MKECHEILLLKRTTVSSIILTLAPVKLDMHHPIVKAIKDEKATGVYLIIMDDFRGHKHHHIDHARNALNHCKFMQPVD